MISRSYRHHKMVVRFQGRTSEWYSGFEYGSTAIYETREGLWLVVRHCWEVGSDAGESHAWWVGPVEVHREYMRYSTVEGDAKKLLMAYAMLVEENAKEVLRDNRLLTADGEATSSHATQESPEAPEVIAGAFHSPEPDDDSRKHRDQGKADQCLGLYVAALQEGRTPPSVTELAATVGCSKATASRAIKPVEEKRGEIARQDAAIRYRDYDIDEDIA